MGNANVDLAEAIAFLEARGSTAQESGYTPAGSLGLLSDAEDFDLYCAQIGVAPQDQGNAFALWLNSIAGDVDF